MANIPNDEFNAENDNEEGNVTTIIKRSLPRDILRKFIGYTYDFENRTYYYFLKHLGSGSFGSTFSSNTTGGPRADWVVKDFVKPTLSSQQQDAVWPAGSVIVSNAPKFIRANIEREFQISRILLMRLGSRLCETYLVCAHRLFFDHSGRRASLVFPFVVGVDLEKWLLSVQYPLMRQFRALLQQEKSATLEEAVQKLDSAQRSFRIVTETRLAAIKELLRLRSTVQASGLVIAFSLVNTLADLHHGNVYHRDLKPDNVLIDTRAGVNTPRIIDFGSACATKLEDDTSAEIDEMFSPIVCQAPDALVGAHAYRDPLSTKRNLGRSSGDEDEDFFLSRYDVYSMGKILQRIFDDRATTQFPMPQYPLVRKTVFMPNGLYELIVRMTGEENYRPNQPQFAGLDFSAEELSRRRESFRNRPTAERCVSDLLAIFNSWDAEVDAL